MTVKKEDDPDFNHILAYLLRVKGFVGHSYKPNYIKRRIAVRMRSTGSENYRQYLGVLEKDPQEPSHLLDRLTIHVTEFFRDPSVYKALEEKILPGFEGLKGGRLRVWCAGCSTGEEAYSVAVLLKEWTATQPGLSFEILATDIDMASVKTAEKGDYPVEAVKAIPRPRLARWFRTAGPRVLVSQDLKHQVRFKVQDLLGKWEPVFSDFHLILCRNLLIYLTGPQQQRLYEQFAGSLLPEGCLILGLTETLLGPARRFFHCVDVKHRVYRVISGAGTAPATGE